MTRLALGFLVLAACGSDPTYPEPFLPTVDGWRELAPVVVIGQPARFEIDIDWGGPFPEGLLWRTTYDRIVAGIGGLPPDPENLPTVIRDGDTHQLVELPTRDGIGWIGTFGNIEVCQDRDDYIWCVQLELPEAWVRVAGGDALEVDFPLDEVGLLVGERRPFQAQGSATFGTSHEVVSYSSSAPSIVTVDELGVLEGIAPGTAILTGDTGAAEASITVTVAAGTPALPTAPVLVSARNTGLPLATSYFPGRTFDTLAIAPDGSPAFVIAPDNVGRPHDGYSGTIPLELVRWTGSGLGIERISEWWENIRTPFFAIAPDGHLFAGWLADMGTGLTLLDRAGDVAAGGWQRRRLPMRPDPSVGAERETGAHWPSDWGNEATPPGGIRTLVGHVIIGTMQAPDGVWIAYGWGASLEEYPGGLPASYESTCVRTLRLAHVTPSTVTTEEVDVQFHNPLDCANALLGRTEEAFVQIAVGPAMDGSDRPTIVAIAERSNAGGGSYYKFQHGAAGWLVTERAGSIEGQTGASGAAFAWSPGVDGTPFIVGGEAPWGAIGTGGAAWAGGNTIGSGRVGPYGNRTFDCMLGPAFPGSDTPLDLAFMFPFNAVRGGYGQLAAVSQGDPPGAPPPGQFNRTWLYQVALPVPPRAEDVDTLGTRLSATADTPRYAAILAFADGIRVGIGRPLDFMEGLSSSRSTGPGQPFSDPTAVTGVTVPTNHRWTAWSDGTRAWIAQGAGPVTLSRSSDHGATATPVASPVTSGGPPLRAISTSPNVSWLLTGPVGGAQGAQLWRLDDSSGTMVVAERPAGTWPGLVVMGLTGGPLYSNVIEGTSSVWVLAWMQVSSTFDRQLVTRHYALDGTLLGEHAAPMNAIPLVASAAVTGSGTLVLPMLDAIQGTWNIQTSTNGGTTWTVTSTISGVLDEAFPTLVQLPDGRVALVATWRMGGDAEMVGMITSADGVTWSTVRWIRPDGGHVQRPWVTTIDASGDLLVHLGDAGTISGHLARDAAYDSVASAAWNKTSMEALLVRVVAP